MTEYEIRVDVGLVVEMVEVVLMQYLSKYCDHMTFTTSIV